MGIFNKNVGTETTENVNTEIEKNLIKCLETRNNMLKKKWLLVASIFTLVLVTFYMILHLSFKQSGAENIYLQKDQLSVINSIIIQQVDSVKLPIDSSKVAANNQTSVSSAKNVAPVIANTVKMKATPQLAVEHKRLLIGNYIRKTINGVDSSEVEGLLKAYEPNQLITVLPYYPFRVKSFFWLVGEGVLLEVVFWSLFGLIAALMYSVTSIRNFNEHMIREHIGKVFYTPFICVAIYLSLNALMNSGSISLLGVGKGVLVLSFILGFFTRRAILLLVKIKDLILPKTQDVIDSDNEIRNMYPNEINGIVKNDFIDANTFTKNTENILITVTRIDTKGTRKSTFSVTETATEDGHFYFNSLYPGDYDVHCEMTIGPKKYLADKTVQVFDSDRPVVLELSLK